MPKEDSLPMRKKMRKGTHSCFECTFVRSLYSQSLVLHACSSSTSIHTINHIYFCPVPTTFRYLLIISSSLMYSRPPPQDSVHLPVRQPRRVFRMLRTR